MANVNVLNFWKNSLTFSVLASFKLLNSVRTKENNDKRQNMELSYRALIDNI
uniref:Uncharacterized protein n=1 Tax=Heterorhabditis bacteriophora TaxID=37862 RepID=A0A1I7X3W3_HETBA